MKRIIAAVTMCLLSACFDAPQMLPLGSIDGGNSNPAGGGNAAGGGSANTGGGGGGGGGNEQQDDGGFVIIITDGGLVYPLPELPEESCGTQQQFACPNDAGACVTWETPGSQQIVITTAQLDNFTYIAGRVGDELAYVTSSADGGSALWTAAAGRAPKLIHESEEIAMSALSASPSGYAWWFVGAQGSGPNSRRYEISYVLPTGGVNQAVSPKAAPPVSNGVAYGSSYVVALADGLHAFYPAGESLLVPMSVIANDSIPSIAVDEATEDVFYVRFDITNGHRLWRHSHSSGNETLLTDLPAMGGIYTKVGGMIALHDGYVYVISVVGLYRVPMTGGALQLVFRGEAFPQYGGTLKSASLVRHGDKFYFGKICHFDADAPGYGTVELDIANLSARWLDLDPAYPLVPHVVGYQAWANEGSVYASPSGAFIFRN